MAIDHVVDSTKLNPALTSTADAIRRKTGLTQDLVFDFANEKGFKDAVDNIPSGKFNVESVIENQEQTLYITDSGVAGVFQVYRESGDVDFITGANLTTFTAPFDKTYSNIFISAIMTGVYKKENDSWVLLDDFDFSKTTIGTTQTYVIYKFTASTSNFNLDVDIPIKNTAGVSRTIGTLRFATAASLTVSSSTANVTYSHGANLVIGSNTISVTPSGTSGRFCSPYFGSRWHYDIYAW